MKDEDMNFGPVIKRLRLKNGMTQEDLCAATDYTLQPAYLSRIERKNFSISWKILNAVCKALGVSVADVIREAEGGEAIEESTQRILIRDINGNKTGRTLPIEGSLPVHSYALSVINDSMDSPSGVSYFEGGFIIATPCESIASGQDYIFLVDDKLVPGRYKTDGRRHFIYYLNPQWPPEGFETPPEVKGRIVGFSYLSTNM